MRVVKSNKHIIALADEDEFLALKDKTVEESIDIIDKPVQLFYPLTMTEEEITNKFIGIRE